jgi:very-short-patch-repair endonuclease
MRDASSKRITRARRLRRNATDAERRLRYRLRSRQIDGAKFARQEPIGPYVVDFVCREQRLIVEVDGGQRATDSRDAARDNWLSGRGYRVLRIRNNDVLANTEGVLESIGAALSEARFVRSHITGGRTRGAVPYPDPLPASGERERARSAEAQ